MEKQETLTGQDLPNYKETSWLKQYDVEDKSPEGIMKEAIKFFTVGKRKKQLPKFWVASSGGNDSMVVADILDKLGMLEGIFHIRIYGGVKVTLDFIKETCQKKGWRLEIREPKPKYIMVALVLETGFPSFFLHAMYMSYLKKETTERFIHEKEIKSDNPVIVTGIRKFESERRFGNFEFPIQVAEQDVRYVCPIFYFTDSKKYEYTLEHKVESTPAKKILGHSGECPCGSFAHKHEAQHWHDTDQHSTHFLKWLEYGVKYFGTETAKKYAEWGGQGMSQAEAQTYLDANFTPREQQVMKIAEALFCGVECGAGTMRGLLGN